MIVVGGVIPPSDYPALYAAGARAIFGPGTNIPEAAADLIEKLNAELGYGPRQAAEERSGSREGVSTMLGRLIGSALLFAVMATTACAQAWYEPARGSKERRDLMDAMRPVIEAKLNPPVEFVVHDLRVLGN